jgi:hypothetical protein
MADDRKLGDMSPSERDAAVKRAVTRFQEELDRAAPRQDSRWHEQYADQYGNTLDVTGDPAGISIAQCAGGVREDVDVPAHQIPELLATLLFGPREESMPELAARYTAYFTPPPFPCPRCGGTGRVEYDETAPATGQCDECDGTCLARDQTPVGPQYVLPWLMSAYLARLTEHRDYKTWDEQHREDTDGMLREIIAMAYTLRSELVAGIPDFPALAEPHLQRKQRLLDQLNTDF